MLNECLGDQCRIFIYLTRDAARAIARRAKNAARVVYAAAVVIGWLVSGSTCALADMGSKSAEKLVFAHYMVCCSMAGPNGTIDAFKREIANAQKAGIDGFALNVGSWTIEPYYQVVTERLFDAAAQLGSGFKLFFSFDSLSLGDSVSALRRFGASGNYFKKDGRLVVSTYGENESWGTSLRDAMRSDGYGIFYIPSYSYQNNEPGSKDEPDGVEVYQSKRAAETDIDGYFQFGAGAAPAKLTKQIISSAHALKARSKLMMVGIAPYYKGFDANSRVFETAGFQGMEQEWRAAIEAGADWVELVTWNDWSEATYLAPLDDSRSQLIVHPRWGPLLSHDAYLAASQYFIKWFKTGVEPTIDNDQIFFFYRLHPKNSIAVITPWGNPPAIGRPKGWEDLQDCMFLTAITKNATRLRISNGGVVRELGFNSGLSNMCLPLRAGRVGLSILRSDGAWSSEQRSIDFSDYGFIGNFNYISGTIVRD